MGIGSYLFSAASKAYVVQSKLVKCITYVIPSYVNYIYRVDTNGKLCDEFSIRGRLVESSVYLIGTWCHDTCTYHRYLLSGAVIAHDIGHYPWVHMTSRELVTYLHDKYDKLHDVDSAILAIMIDDDDVSDVFADMRSTLSLPNNATAGSLVLLHAYLTHGAILPYHATITSMAVEFLQHLHDPEPTNTPQEWQGFNKQVTVIDYDLNEIHSIGNDYLFTLAS